MTDTDPFDDVIRNVAEANDVALEPLEAAVADHQEQTLRTDGVGLNRLPDGYATVVVRRP